MSNLKLTIDHLKNYLGTGLKIQWFDQFNTGYFTVSELLSVSSLGVIHLNDKTQGRISFHIGDMQDSLICYRLSDLDKFIPELGFVPAEQLIREGWAQHQIALICQGAYTHISFAVMEQLFSWHFWPFGEQYFQAGLVIDKMTHGEEVSNG